MSKKVQLILGIFAFAAFLALALILHGRLEEAALDPVNLLIFPVEDEIEISYEDEAEPNPLERAPDFIVFDADGNEVRLSDSLGMPVVLNFWTTWCPSCVRETPHFENLYIEKGNEVRILKVNLPDVRRETRQTVDDFMAQNGYTFPVYFDTNRSAAQAYDITAIPRTFFITSDGYIAGTIMGSVTAETLQAGLDAIL